MRASATTGTLLALALTAMPDFAPDGRPLLQVAAPAPGAIHGLVRLTPGTAAEPTVVVNTTDPDVCGQHQTMEDLIVAATGGVAHAIVALEDVPAAVVPDIAPGRLVLDNRQCRFVPHAAVLTTGSTIEAVNSDDVLHTVHLYGPLAVNIALPLQGMRVTRVVDRPGMIVVKCDAHGWMQAFIRVDPHPFHAVSDATGAFSIVDVPAGEYTISVWHERLGTLDRRVRVRSGAATQVEFEYGI